MTATKPRNDIYTGLLFVSFLALMTGCVLLLADFREYGAKSPPKLIIPATN